MTLPELRQRIWTHRRINKNLVNLQVYADRAGVILPITDVVNAETLLKSLTKKVKKKVETPQWCIDRYNKAHEEYFASEYPAAYKDGHYAGMEPDFPDMGTGNGINKFIVNYLTWKGHRATRINVSGRLIESTKTEASGNKFNTKKYIKSSTRTGAADVSSTINGRSCQWEGKAGRDTPKPEQLREQQLERKAGGSYEFVHSAEEFFHFYDKLTT